MIFRIKLIIPPNERNSSEFIAWLDNNDHFNNTEGRARIFNDLQEVTDELHRRADGKYKKMMGNLGSTYYIEEFIPHVGWIYNFDKVEQHLNSLCEV